MTPERSSSGCFQAVWLASCAARRAGGWLRVRESLAAGGSRRPRVGRGLSWRVRGKINRTVQKSNPTATVWTWNQWRVDTAQVRTSSRKITTPYPTASSGSREEQHQNLLESLKYPHPAQGTGLRGGGTWSRSCAIHPLLWVLTRAILNYDKLLLVSEVCEHLSKHSQSSSSCGRAALGDYLGVWQWLVDIKTKMEIW